MTIMGRFPVHSEVGKKRDTDQPSEESVPKERLSWRCAYHKHSMSRFMGHFKGGISRYCRADACYTSTIFSNLGVAYNDSPLAEEDAKLRVEDMILESIEFFPPLRPLSHVACAVVSYADQLTVSVQVDPNFLKHEDAESFLSYFTESMTV